MKDNMIKYNLVDNKEENLKLIKDELPDNVKFSMEPLSRKLEDLCAQVNYNITVFFNKTENILEYGILVVKIMEYVDNIKSLSANDKYTVVVRCIIEIIKKEKSFQYDIENYLILTILGLIEAVIKLKKV